MNNAVVAAAAAAVMLAASAAGAQTELRYATAAPENTPWGTFLKTTIADVEKAAPDLKITPFYSSQLGDEQTVIRQVVRGRIDMSGQSGVATSLLVPEFALLSAPYLFRDPAQSDCVFDNHVRPIFEDYMNKSGLVTLSWVEVGHSYISAKEPIVTPDKAQGFKMRIPPTRATALFWTEAGVNGVPMGVVDMVPALKTGQVNGIQTSTVYGIAIGLPKLAPHTIVGKFTHDIGTVTVSKRVWDKLTPKHQEALRLIDARVGDLRKAIRGAETALLAKVEKAGAPVYRLSEEQIAQWKKFAEPAAMKLIDEIGNKAPEIWKQIQTAKQKCS